MCVFIYLNDFNFDDILLKYFKYYFILYYRNCLTIVRDMQEYIIFKEKHDYNEDIDDSINDLQYKRLPLFIGFLFCFVKTSFLFKLLIVNLFIVFMSFMSNCLTIRP